MNHINETYELQLEPPHTRMEAETCLHQAKAELCDEQDSWQTAQYQAQGQELIAQILHSIQWAETTKWVFQKLKIINTTETAAQMTTLLIPPGPDVDPKA